MNRWNRPGILQFCEDQKTSCNPPLAPAPLAAAGKYGVPLPYVIARKTRGPHYGRDDFRGGEGRDAPALARANLEAVLSRARPKELAVDYLEREFGPSPIFVEPAESTRLAAVGQIDEPAVAPAAGAPAEPLSIDERAARARDRWLAYRQAIDAGKTAAEAFKATGVEADRGREKDQARDGSYGLDDDLPL